MAALKRTHNFNVRLSDDEHAMLVALADAKGLTASDLVRQFVRRSYREHFADEAPDLKQKSPRR